jgi:hypothetical protein
MNARLVVNYSDTFAVVAWDHRAPDATPRLVVSHKPSAEHAQRSADRLSARRPGHYAVVTQATAEALCGL